MSSGYQGSYSQQQYGSYQYPASGTGGATAATTTASTGATSSYGTANYGSYDGYSDSTQSYSTQGTGGYGTSGYSYLYSNQPGQTASSASTSSAVTSQTASGTSGYKSTSAYTTNSSSYSSNSYQTSNATSATKGSSSYSYGGSAPPPPPSTQGGTTQASWDSYGQTTTGGSSYIPGSYSAGSYSAGSYSSYTTSGQTSYTQASQGAYSQASSYAQPSYSQGAQSGTYGSQSTSFTGKQYGSQSGYSGQSAYGTQSSSFGSQSGNNSFGSKGYGSMSGTGTAAGTGSYVHGSLSGSSSTGSYGQSGSYGSGFGDQKSSSIGQSGYGSYGFSSFSKSGDSSSKSETDHGAYRSGLGSYRGNSRPDSYQRDRDGDWRRGGRDRDRDNGGRYGGSGRYGDRDRDRDRGQDRDSRDRRSDDREDKDKGRKRKAEDEKKDKEGKQGEDGDGRTDWSARGRGGRGMMRGWRGGGPDFRGRGRGKFRGGWRGRGGRGGFGEEWRGRGGFGPRGGRWSWGRGGFDGPPFPRGGFRGGCRGGMRGGFHGGYGFGDEEMDGAPDTSDAPWVTTTGSKQGMIGWKRKGDFPDEGPDSKKVKNFIQTGMTKYAERLITETKAKTEEEKATEKKGLEEQSKELDKKVDQVYRVISLTEIGQVPDVIIPEVPEVFSNFNYLIYKGRYTPLKTKGEWPEVTSQKNKKRTAQMAEEQNHTNKKAKLNNNTTQLPNVRQAGRYSSNKLMHTTVEWDLHSEEEAREVDEFKPGNTFPTNNLIPVEEGWKTASPESGTKEYEHTIFIDGDNVPKLCSNINQTQIDPGIQVRFVCNTSLPSNHLEALDKSVHKEIVETKDNASDVRIVRRVSETRAKYPKKHLIRIISRDKGFEQITPFVVNLDIKKPSQENIFKLENHKSTYTTLLETVFKAIRSNPYLNEIIFVQHSSRNDVRKWDESERYTYTQPTQLKIKLQEKLQGKNVMVLMFYKKSNLNEWEYWFQCLLNQHKNFFTFGSTREDGSIFQLLTSVISIHNHLHPDVDFSVYSDKGEDMPLKAEIHSSCKGRHILICNEQRLTMGT